jgi:pimeloyl-ACP methyl ester carboxylesterase
MELLERVFGPSRQDPKTWNPFVVVRHGIFSDDLQFQPISRFLSTAFPMATIDNQKYDWKDSVVLNGARLANAILRDPNTAGRTLVLIGHSMGGLICRVASLILSEPDIVTQHQPLFKNYCLLDPTDLQTLKGLALSAKQAHPASLVITLATPNSGALLRAQINGLALIGKKIFSSHMTSVNDLTTVRLFQLLQYFSVGTRVLSISGSGWNRYGKAPASALLRLAHLAGRLHLPNDMIVEDRSVDLTQSILQNEVVSSSSAKYLHVRLYTDCINVVHDNIYDHWKVREIVADCLTRC